MRKLRLSVLGVAVAACLLGELIYRNEHSATSNENWVAATTKAIQASLTKPTQQYILGNQVRATSQRESGNTTAVVDDNKPTASSASPPTKQKTSGSSQSQTTRSESQTSGMSVTASSPTQLGSIAEPDRHHSSTSAHATGTTSVKSSVSRAVSQSESKGTSGSRGVATPAPNLGSFTLSLSEDNGQTQLKQLTVEIVQGESLMQYMHQYFQVQTIDGGDFVVGINGILSQWTGVPVTERQPVDWFLYVNGKQAPVGASDIYPHSGDVDLWDYHRWDPNGGN